jgi:chemotaxis protein CheX
MIKGTSVQTQLTGPDLAAIVESAVTMMLGLDLGEPCESDADTPITLGASVQFMGDWDGAVVVGCDASFGTQAAAAMFGIDSSAVSDDEVADALGELANMIAGNVKPLLPNAAAISLPTVVHGADLRLDIPGGQAVVAIVFRGPDTTLTVRIYKRAG